MIKRRVAFLTTNDFGFGGSEDLWAGAAKTLLRDGHHVAVSVRDWSPRPRLLEELIDLRATMLWHQLPPTSDDFSDLIEFDPELVVVSQGYHLEGIDWLAQLAQRHMPFIIVNECVHEAGWPSAPEQTLAYINGLHAQAREYCFVSDGNRRLHERFFGQKCPRSAVVRNPFKVPYDADLPWPVASPLRLATVGRLECFHKGYDLLMEALHAPQWLERDWELHLFGDGPHRALLERLAPEGLRERIIFHGHTTDIAQIWREHHVLVQPSRLEGMPMSVVEAMLCGRPVLATAVAGHPEWIDDGIQGFLAEAATTPHVQRALEAMWLARDRLQDMGRAAQEKARLLTPPDPCGAFAARILKHAESVATSGDLVRIRRATVRTSIPGTNDDHLAHLYYTNGGKFSEDTKVAAFYPGGPEVRLTFSGLRGRIRLDPSARPGTFHVFRTILTRLDTGESVLNLEGDELKQAWRVEGTAHATKPTEAAGVALESTGTDPILQLTAWPGDEQIAVRLEVDIRAT